MAQTKKIIITVFLALMASNTDLLWSKKSIEWFLPIKVDNRQSWEKVRLTSIGRFGIKRKARPNIPAHLHTGVDLKRPNDNYVNEPIFPVAKGKVISLRDDGPYAQIIIEHILEDSSLIWTVYEHVAGIKVRLGEFVNPYRPIARFMSRDELEKYGWQFDHVHFEIMKVKPKPLNTDRKRPYRYYGTYSLECYNRLDLKKRYYDPKKFFYLKWNQ